MDTLEAQKIQDEQVPLLKEKKVRQKKPRSEKQLEHFANMAAKRKENIEKKKLEKKIESAKLLIEHDIQVAPPSAPKKTIRKQLKEAIEEPQESVESASEEEIIVKTKRSKPKKKAKKVIIVQESDSETEEEEEEPLPQPKRRLKTQQNKKSIVKVYEQEQPQLQGHHCSSQMNFFCE